MNPEPKPSQSSLADSGGPGLSPVASPLFGSELRRDLLVIALVCAWAAFASQKKPADGIQMHDFSRKVDVSAARFSFLLENRSAHPVTAVVTVSAENGRDGHEGIQLWPLGVTNMQVTLAAHEQRKMAGSIDFGSSGGTLVLFHYLRVVPAGPVAAPAFDVQNLTFEPSTRSGPSVEGVPADLNFTMRDYSAQNQLRQPSVTDGAPVGLVKRLTDSDLTSYPRTFHLTVLDYWAFSTSTTPPPAEMRAKK